MTIRNLGDETTTLTAEGAELKLERAYDATRAQVWGALTSAEQIPNWWGPAGTTVKVGEMDVRTGGQWQITLTADGYNVTLSGEFKEVVDGEKLVRTSLLDSEPDGTPTVETITLEEAGGKTTLKHSATFASAEALDGDIEYGVDKNLLGQYARLADAAK